MSLADETVSLLNDVLDGHVTTPPLPDNVRDLLVMARRTCRTHQRQDRSALLRMAGNIASGVMPGGWMSGNATFESVAKACVSLARAILAEVDGD